MTELQSPSLMRRLVAICYDSLLVLAVVLVVNALALGVQVKLIGGQDHALNPLVAQLLLVTSVFGFFMLFWLSAGQTLGMQAWRLKLVSSNGNALTFTQTLVRCLGATLSWACLGAGYLWALLDREGKTWHDRLSGTQLQLLPKSSRDKQDSDDEKKNKGQDKNKKQ